MPAVATLRERFQRTSRRHFLQVGEPAQQSALETRPTHCLPNAPCPMPNNTKS
ncbi:hypothetical protein [Nostoc sp. 106C]|uniref:hypothetical protein n=1 Tax=Nostoc sp. 106C TaxID=1932667 RepID=UPI001AA19C2C|nr:hypothetical protein [Nostoc sp. 106C]